MYTLGDVTVRKIIKSEDGCITLGLNAKTAVEKTAVVKIDTAGEVEHVAAATDFPFGTVEVAAKAGETATIITPFVQIQKAIASGNVAIGARLAISGFNTSAKLPTGIVAVTTNFVSAVALSGGTNGQEITIGILRTPYLMTTA
jgi:hypothetical protein